MLKEETLVEKDVDDLGEERFIEGVVALRADFQHRVEDCAVLSHVLGNKVGAPTLDHLFDACHKFHDRLPRLCCKLEQLANDSTTTSSVCCVVSHAQHSHLEMELHQRACLVQNAIDQIGNLTLEFYEKHNNEKNMCMKKVQ